MAKLTSWGDSTALPCNGLKTPSFSRDARGHNSRSDDRVAPSPTTLRRLPKLLLGEAPRAAPEGEYGEAVLERKQCGERPPLERRKGRVVPARAQRRRRDTGDESSHGGGGGGGDGGGGGGGGGGEGGGGGGSRPQVLGERAAAARAGFVAERAEESSSLFRDVACRAGIDRSRRRANCNHNVVSPRSPPRAPREIASSMFQLSHTRHSRSPTPCSSSASTTP